MSDKFSSIEQEEQASRFLTLVDKASNLPLVKVNRMDYLKAQFGTKYGDEVIKRMQTMSPKQAGVSEADIEMAAKGCINLSTTTTSVISTVAGIPGGLAMIGTIPGDLIQFYGHVINVMQKLMYIYGYGSISDMGDEAKNVLVIFLGVMFGVEGIGNAVTSITKVMADAALRRIPNTKVAQLGIYKFVKHIAIKLGAKTFSKEVFAKGVAKAIPVLGGVVSGGITLATFRPMCTRLQKVLRENSI